uniref:Peptidase S9 prolyl oligopeptidase catalytic domain-containing protein n=1 Tax=Panagrolaimus superbus TaxID=310955 RepID=A0A914YWJ4_9BILA
MSKEQQKPSQEALTQNDERQKNHPILNQLKNHQEDESHQCASTQSSRTIATPTALKTPQNDIQKPIHLYHNQTEEGSIRKINNNTENTQTGTVGDYDEDKKTIQSPNPSSGSSFTDSSDTTQNLSQDDMMIPPVMPIKLPGRKLDVTRKSSKTKMQSSPKQQHHKRRLLPKRNIFIPGGGDSAHKKRCCEYQRKRTRKVTGPVVGRMKHKEFLKAVDRHRNSRNVIDCVCEPEQFGCIRSAQFYVSQAGRQTKSFVGTFCCPPWPKTCFAKVAFWPPNRGYFFVSYAKHLPWSATLVQKHKIIKAKRTITLDENFSIGLEHSCCDRVEGVTTFVIQNSFKHFIAGFIAKPHKRIDAKLWIIYSHPNGSDLSDLMTLMPSPVQIADYLGANILAYDYPGYGISTGKPSEKTFYATIHAIIEYVTVTLEVPIESIVLWGYSIGTVCSVHAAMNYSVAGVFLFAPVASIMRTLKSNTCFDNGKVKEKTSCLDSFSNLDMVSLYHEVKSPLLIAHGELDTLIPISHGQALLEKATTTNSKSFAIWCKDVGHNNIPNSSELWKRVKDFLISNDIINAKNLRAKHAEHHQDQSKKSICSRKTHRKKQSIVKTPEQQQQNKSSKMMQSKTPTKIK